MSNRIEDLYREVHSLPKRLKNHVLGMLDPACGSLGGTVVAFWQESVRATEGRGTGLQQEVDEFLNHVDAVLAATTIGERLEWITWHHEAIVCGTYGGATSFVSNFVTGCPRYSLGHERVYKNDDITLRSSLAGFIRGDCSGAAWRYVKEIAGKGPKVVQVVRNPLHACGCMMNNNSAAIPKTFESCAEYWYAHHLTLEGIKDRYVIRVEDWERRCDDLLDYLHLTVTPDCWSASEGTRRNPRGGERPWTWDDLPEHVIEMAEGYGYSP